MVGSHDIYVAHGAHTINEVAQSLGLDAVVVGNKNKWFHGTKIRKRCCKPIRQSLIVKPLKGGSVAMGRCDTARLPVWG